MFYAQRVYLTRFPTYADSCAAHVLLVQVFDHRIITLLLLRFFVLGFFVLLLVMGDLRRDDYLQLMLEGIAFRMGRRLYTGATDATTRNGIRKVSWTDWIRVLAAFIHGLFLQFRHAGPLPLHARDRHLDRPVIEFSPSSVPQHISLTVASGYCLWNPSPGFISFFSRPWALRSLDAHLNHISGFPGIDFDANGGNIIGFHHEHDPTHGMP